MKKMFAEFREFAMRGSVIDLAVGIVIGAAFTSIVNSFVEDILMPPIGMLLGNVDFANLFISLDGVSYPSLLAAQEAGAPTLNYGLFINNVINFLIVAFLIFLIVKQVNRLKGQPVSEPEDSDTKECPYCRSTISIDATRCPFCTSQLPEDVNLI